MMKLFKTSLVALLVMTLPFRSGKAAKVNSKCKTLRTLVPFNLTMYVTHEWYSIEQRPTSFQPRRDMFCVRANYTLEGEKSISIWNTATRDGVSGAVRNAEGLFKLRGIIEDPDVNSKILVGLPFLPLSMYEPYWIVAGDLDKGGTKWAFISGGPLSTPRSFGLCEPSGGLWLLASDPFVSENLIREIKSRVRDLGIDCSALVRVQHRGCDYPTL